MSKEIENLEPEKEVEVQTDDLVVEIDDEEVSVELADDDDPAPVHRGPSIEDGIEELRAQLEEEQKARLKAEKELRKAEKRAQDAEVEVSAARSEVEDTNLQLLNGAINDIKREQTSYKAAIRDALENGDYDKAAEYQEAMAVNVAKLMKIEEGKIAYQNRPKDNPRSSDAVENFASKLSPRSAEWIRRNPEYVTDPRLNQKMLAAHQMAVADGNIADTDEYFEYVEDVLKMDKKDKDRKRSEDGKFSKEQDDPTSSAAAPVQRRSAPPAAPVSRQAPSATTTRPNVVRLNSEEREMAQMMGMTNEEYARNKLLLIKEGKLH